jgi:protein-disulfide isomerase
VKFTYKYFPIFPTGESVWAAEAAECANQQGKFWEYHDKLFAAWSGENVGTYTKANLKKYATEVNLDTAKFNRCLDNDETASVIQADQAEARGMGIRSTPTFLVNGKPLRIRLLDFSEFAQTLDLLLR